MHSSLVSEVKQISQKMLKKTQFFILSNFHSPTSNPPAAEQFIHSPWWLLPLL
jgi:hypothetical protein